MSDPTVTLHHAPRSRSSVVLRLLEELEAPYRLVVLDLEKGDQRAPSHLALNPMGKVPTLVDGETVVTELGAITLYLGERFADAGLCPMPGDALRGPLLRWLFFYGNCVEPALLQKRMDWSAPSHLAAGYGSYEDTLATVIGQLTKGPWILGERFTVADGLWGPALTWFTAFGLMPKAPEISAYVARFAARPAAARAAEIDTEILARRATVRA